MDGWMCDKDNKMFIVESKWQVREGLLFFSFNFSECLKSFNTKRLGKSQPWVFTACKVQLVGEEREEDEF